MEQSRKLEDDPSITAQVIQTKAKMIAMHFLLSLGVSAGLRRRTISNPMFSSSNIRSMIPIFREVAENVRKISYVFSLDAANTW